MDKAVFVRFSSYFGAVYTANRFALVWNLLSDWDDSLPDVPIYQQQVVNQLMDYVIADDEESEDEISNDDVNVNDEWELRDKILFLESIIFLGYKYQ